MLIFVEVERPNFNNFKFESVIATKIMSKINLIDFFFFFSSVINYHFLTKIQIDTNY